MPASRSQRGDALESSSLRPPTTPSRATSFDNETVPSSAPNPTYAAFSPNTLSGAPATSAAAKRRSTILVHQKSPLLLATPPQITRALAYSHPFLLPLNKLAGLLSWTTDDAWESFLLVAAWWATVLYGDFVVRAAGPIVLVLALIAGMYGRRYSPLSSSGWMEDAVGATKPSKGRGRAKSGNNQKADGTGAGAGAKGGGGDPSGGAGAKNHQRSASEATHTRHQKTLDEIVETLKEFTTRCNILLEPLLELTDFLSTQRTATSATTRPALTTLFVRILLCTPFWFALTLPPWRIVTTRRIMLVVGTVGLTWHARVMKVARTLLWRSASVRKLAALVTGLQFEEPMEPTAQLFPTASDLSGTTVASKASSVPSKASAAKRPVTQESELTKAIRRARGGHDAGVRFTFILYENQRRWVGLGWTTSLFAYERPAWTDEHNHGVPPCDEFELPEVEDGSKMRWQWVEGGRWKVDGVPDDAVRTEKKGSNGESIIEWKYDGEGGRNGWIYYDNKWQNGRRGQDGWTRWTRRRKWYRDAELVEAEPRDDASNNSASQTDEHTQTPASSQAPSLPPRPSSPAPSLPSAIGGTGGVAAESQSMPNLTEELAPREEDDSVSVLSTSSRSTRFKSPTIRRHVTDSGRSRRASEAASEDETASLGTRLGLEIQGAGTEGWGIGDDARMTLE